MIKKKSRKTILKKRDKKLDTIGYSKLDIMFIFSNSFTSISGDPYNRGVAALRSNDRLLCASKNRFSPIYIII